jgi:hypothetical protein
MERLLLSRVQNGTGVKELRRFPILNGSIRVLFKTSLSKNYIDILNKREIIDLCFIFIHTINTF